MISLLLTLRHQVSTHIVNIPVWLVFTCNVARQNHEDLCTFVSYCEKPSGTSFIWIRCITSASSPQPKWCDFTNTACNTFTSLRKLYLLVIQSTVWRQILSSKQYWCVTSLYVNLGIALASRAMWLLEGLKFLFISKISSAHLISWRLASLPRNNHVEHNVFNIIKHEYCI